MTFEQKICAAIDDWVDGKDVEKTVFTIIDEIKINLKEKKTAELYWYWGQSLEILDEYEQASLKFEEALKLSPNNKDMLWSLISLLLFSLQTPEPAKNLLKERLLPLDPSNEKYLDALATAEKTF